MAPPATAGERRGLNDLVGQKCRERGDGDADGKRGYGQPTTGAGCARGPHTEHDSHHHQQHADDRGPWRVVGVGHIDSPWPRWPGRGR